MQSIIQSTDIDMQRAQLDRMPFKSLSLNAMRVDGKAHIIPEEKTEEVPKQICDDPESEWKTPPNGNAVKMVAPTPLKDYWTLAAIELQIGQFDLKSEYMAYLRRSEHKSFAPWFTMDAFHIPYRRRIVDWIFHISTGLKLHRTTIYRAVLYFDRICSAHTISPNRLQHVGATCLVIAAKWNEMEQFIPSYRQMAYFCGDADPNLNYKLRDLESPLLSLLNWSLSSVLPIDFVSFFLDQEVLFAGDTIDGASVAGLGDAQVYTEKFTLFFIDIISQKYEYLQFLPSRIAASMIVCARRALRVQPYWNDLLEPVLGCDWMAIRDIVNTIWLEYMERFPEDAKRAVQ